MTANGISGGLYSNVIKSTGNSAVYTPSSSIRTEPLTEKYSVEDNIGRGKFAVVKKCISKDTGEEVAAKFIKKRRRGKSCREEILREVVMLEMALDHPRLVNLKEVYETSSELVLITEYCAGGELFTNCILEEKFNEADVRLLMSQILEGLVYLHERNIVHLDLKPQNILLTEDFPGGSVKICDLGFACLVNTGEDIRDIIGTPDYVAPEVLNYDPLGLYTDMWSLGVLTYVMLTTCSPFAGDDKQETFCNITTVNLDFPKDLFEHISVAAQDFIKKLLVAEPSDRLTAAECMEHEWIVGTTSPHKHISITDIEPSQIGQGDTETLQEQSSNEVKVVEEVGEFESSKSDQHEKVKDETSEMSVTEEADDIRSRSNSESFSGKVMDQDQTHSDVIVSENKGITKPNLGLNESTQENKDSGDVSQGQTEQHIEAFQQKPGIYSFEQAVDTRFLLKSSDIESAVSSSVNQDVDITTNIGNSSETVSQSTNKSSDIGERNLEVKPFSLLSEDVQTPDSESSMCISDGRIDDDDSGVGTGTDTRAESETRTVSRNSDFVVEKELDSDIIEELNTDKDQLADTSEDHEMLSKSFIESELNEIQKGNQNALETDKRLLINDEKVTIVYDLNEKNVLEGGKLDNHTEMEHSDIIENSPHIGETIEQSSLNTGKLDSSRNSFEDGSSLNRIPNPDFQSMDQTTTSPSAIRKLHITVTDVNTETIVANSSNIKSTEQTISGLQDNVPMSSSSGESHKRGMCNLETTQGAENSENQVEYEFVSVSKRVKSYEETVTRVQQFSPKIQRSPRVGRHTKGHQHH